MPEAHARYRPPPSQPLSVSRRGRGYDSVRDLWMRSGLTRAAIERLAEADCFRSIGLDRRDALWAVKALDPLSSAERLPLFAAADDHELQQEPDVHLPPMPLGEHVINDYQSLSFSLKAHPMAFLREPLRRLNYRQNVALQDTASGQRLLVAGLVLVDASGGPMLEEKGDKTRKDSGGGNIGFTIAQTPGINLLVEQITPRSLIAQSLEQSVSVKSVASEAAVDRYWELLRYPGNRRATLKRFGYPYEPLTEGEIAAITAPTLILWGEEDRLIPLAAGQWLAEKMPNAALKAYPRIGHLPQEEAVSQTLADLEPWLAEHAPPAKPE